MCTLDANVPVGRRGLCARSVLTREAVDFHLMHQMKIYGLSGRALQRAVARSREAIVRCLSPALRSTETPGESEHPAQEDPGEGNGDSERNEPLLDPRLPCLPSRKLAQSEENQRLSVPEPAPEPPVFQRDERDRGGSERRDERAPRLGPRPRSRATGEGTPRQPGDEDRKIDADRTGPAPRSSTRS